MTDRYADYEAPQQIIREIHHGAPNGNGHARLNEIVLRVAAWGLLALTGVGLWQVQRLIEKIDNLNDRMIRVEVKLGTVQPIQTPAPTP